MQAPSRPARSPAPAARRRKQRPARGQGGAEGRHRHVGARAGSRASSQPYGATLTINHTANELMYDSLLEWDPKLNIKPALAES